MSVTYGAGGTTRDKTIDIVTRIKRDYGLEAMAHFTCVGATVDELRATLDEMRDAGIENVLALRGDPPRGAERVDEDRGRPASTRRELVELLRADYDFAIGAARFPETHIHATSRRGRPAPPEGEGRRGREVPDHPAVLRQRALLRLRRRAPRRPASTCRSSRASCRSPTSAQIKRITELCGATLPPALVRELDARADDPEAVAELRRRVRDAAVRRPARGGAPGIHFYTLNRSPATRAILSALRCMSPWRRAVTA